MAKNEPVSDISKYEPPTSIKVSKTQAGQVSVGDIVSITVKGEVVGVHKGYDDKELHTIELKKSEVTNIEGENAADKEYKKMTRK